MDLALLVYGISILGKIGPALIAIICIISTVLFGCLAYRFVGLGIESWDSAIIVKQKMENRPPIEKWIKRFFIILGITSLLVIAIPSEKTAYMMVGAYTTQKFTENEKVQETGKKVLKLIEQKLDTYIDEGIKDAERQATKAIKGGDKKQD